MIVFEYRKAISQKQMHFYKDSTDHQTSIDLNTFEGLFDKLKALLNIHSTTASFSGQERQNYFATQD